MNPKPEEDLLPSPGERVFRNWELVMEIFKYLPWSEVCRLRNLSQETWYACRYSVREITDPKANNIEENEIYDFLLALGAKGCHKLKKIDLLSSTTLSANILPILKFCGDLEHLALIKNDAGRDMYMSMIYNTDVSHLAIKATEVHYFQDVDLIDIMLILQNITKLEIINGGITDIALAEISDEMNTLTLLNVSGCIGITDIGLIEILNKCDKLKHLNVRNTPTMKDCVQQVKYKNSLVYLNAMETNLVPEDAEMIKKHFHNFIKPFEFLWSRSKVVDQTYELETVHEFNRNGYSGYKGMNDENMFDSIHIDEHLWNNAEVVKSRPIEKTARQYLSELKEVCKRPLFDQSSMVVHNWSELAFKGGPKEWWNPLARVRAISARLGLRREVDNSDFESEELERFRKENKRFREDKDAFPEENVSKFNMDVGPSGIPENPDSGWRRIYEVEDNLKKLKKEYQVLMEEFQTFEHKN